jgi:hypothetical protein
MRTIRRTVILLGCAGFIALYLLQLRVALAATPLLLVVGALTGLAVAKWLPWAWYGRQFAAGVRGGAVACGLAAAGVLLSLVGGKTPQVPAIAAESRLPGLNLAGIVTSLGGAGWFTPYLLLTACFALGSVLLAGIVARIASWNKSQRTVRVIREAHNSASLLHRNQTWAPASNSIPSAGGYWNSVLPAADPVSHPGLIAAGAAPLAVVNGHPSGGYSAPMHTPVSGGSPARMRGSQGQRDVRAEQGPTYLAPLPPIDFEINEPLESMTPPPMLSDAPEPIPPRRSYSGAQPIPAAMSDDLRQALDHWDDEPPPADSDASDASDAADTETAMPKKTAAKGTAAKPKTPAKRQPKASAYLNSEPPAAPRRTRKKQNTRDWLC